MGSRIITAALCLLFSAGAFGAVIQADRTNDWYQAGVPGGIPNITSVSTTLSPGVTAAQINTAIANCPSNSMVLLNAGTYSLGNNRITINKDGVLLRGSTNAAGFPTTILNGTDVQMARSQWPSAGNWGNISSPNISSGLTEGSTSITLASAPGSDFQVGDLIMIDQLFDGTNVKNSSVTWAHRPMRPYCVVAQVTNISANTIGFQPPLVGEYWSSGLTPQAFGWSSLYGHALKRSGLENCDVIPGNNTYNMTMGPAYACWAKNVRTTAWPTSGGAAGLRLTYSASCSVFWSIFHDQGVVNNSSYAIYPVVVTGCAVEGNIFTNLALGMPCVAAAGCSFSFNYATGPYPYSPAAWLPEYFFPHGGHTHDSLYEGNWLEGPVYFDAIFGGNNSRIAVVHNRIKGWATGKSGNTIPVTLEASMHDIVMLSNILGEDTYHSSYSQMYTISGTSTGTVRTNNYNTVDDAVHSTETINAGDTVATSYRYASKPAWFGSLPWPSFVLTSSSAQNLAYTNSPAGYRNYFQTDPPAGGGGGPTIPTAPQNPAVSSGNASNVFTWTAPASDGGSAILAYEVYRSTSSGAETFLVTVTGLGYTNTGLANGTTYYYKVSATNAIGEGPLSSEVNGTPKTVPTAPQSPAVSSGNASNVVTWAAPSSNGGSSVLGYRVYRSTSSGAETFLTLVTGLGYTNTSLANGTTYYYKIAATNAAGEGPLTSEVSGTPHTIPGAPQSPSVSSGNSSNVFTWSAPASNGGAAIGAYYVYSSTTSGAETFLATVTTTGYTNTGLINGTTYYYKVSATNSSGEGPLSTEASGTPSTVPSAPLNLIVTPGFGQLLIQWDAPSTNGGSAILSYDIYRSTSPGSETLYASGLPSSTYTDSGVVNGTTYYYKSSAVNVRGEGALSGEASGAPVGVLASSLVSGPIQINGGLVLR